MSALDFKLHVVTSCDSVQAVGAPRILASLPVSKGATESQKTVELPPQQFFSLLSSMRRATAVMDAMAEVDPADA